MSGVAPSPEHALSPGRNVLAISARGKVIPYQGSGVARADGQANHGFKNLKGHPELLDEVPELRADAALRSLIAAINAPTTGLFSVGCLSGQVQDEQGFRMIGYVEFALNSRLAAADAASYFPAFFHFDRLLQGSAFAHPVWFFWELCGADFLDSGTGGFTAAVTVNTGCSPRPEGAREAWAAGCGVMEVFLSAIPPHDDEPIYATR